MFITTPKSTSWIPFPEPQVRLKYSFYITRFQHNLCFPDRVPFGYVHLKVNMVSSETKLTKFKTKFLTFLKRFQTGIYMGLFPKTHIPVMGNKHHRHPIVSGVTQNLFRAPASFPFQNLHNPVAPLKGTPLWCAACNGKKISFSR